MALLPFFSFANEIMTVETTTSEITPVGSNIVWNIEITNNTQTSFWYVVAYEIHCTYYNGETVAKFHLTHTTNLLSAAGTTNITVTLTPSEYKTARGNAYNFILKGTVSDMEGEEFWYFFPELLRVFSVPDEGVFSLSTTNGVPVGGTITANASVRNLYPFEINNANIKFIGYGVFRNDKQWAEHTYTFPTVVSNALIQASHQFTVFHEGKQNIRAFFYADEIGYYEIGDIEVGEDPPPPPLPSNDDDGWVYFDDE